MSSGLEHERKLRVRQQREAFYLSQLKAIREKELDDNSKMASMEMLSPLQSPACTFSFEENVETIFDDKIDALEKSLKEHIHLEITEALQKTETKILQEVQALKDIFQKTLHSVYTQTSPELTENKVLAEIEESIIETTEPKVLGDIDKSIFETTEPKIKAKALNQESPQMCEEMYQRTVSVKQNEHASFYDNVTIKPNHSKSDYGSYSLQIRDREKHESIKLPRPYSAIGTRTELYDERVCLANALQFHVEYLVDGIVFRESELPDCLLAEGCLTEDECASARKLRDRKDQIRVLLSLIKGRDLRVLKGFLKHVEQHNSDAAAKIIAKFEENKREGLRTKLCFLCQLEKQFNVKHVADSLWAIQVIDDGLYFTIINSEAPVGAQESVWKKVVHSLNYLDSQTAKLAHEKLLTALTSKGLFTYLADGVQKMLIKNHGRLTCSCEWRPLQPRTSFFTDSISGESLLPYSSSSGTASPVSTFNRKAVKIGDQFDMTLPRIKEDPHSSSNYIHGVNNPHDANAPEDEALPELHSQTFRKSPFSDGEVEYVNITNSDTRKPPPRVKPEVPKKPDRSQIVGSQP